LDEPLQYPAEGQQVDRMEGRATGSNPLEFVRGINIGQISRDRVKLSVTIQIDDPVLAPMTAPADQLELMP
jgi:hypothetical protein